MAKEVKKEKKHFFKDFKAELKKVIWPTPKQLVNNTIAVVTIVLITAAIVFVLDFAFENLNTHVFNGLKGMISSNTEISNEENVDTNTEIQQDEQTADQVN